MAPTGLGGRKKRKLSFCWQGLMESLMPRRSQLGQRLLSGIQRIAKCTHTFSSSSSQTTTCLSSTSNPVVKLGSSSLLSTRRTLPQHIWHFANNSICSRTTLLLVLWCLLMPFFQSLDNSVLLVTNQTT